MKFIYIFTLFCISNFVQAYVIDSTKKGDTIQSVAQRNFEKVQIKYSGIKDYEDDIKKWNPSIRDWNHLPKNQNLYVDYPYDHYVSGSTWAPILGPSEEMDELNRQYSLGAFYASSFGSYSELTSNQTVKSDQNFPVTLGIGFSSTDDEKKHFLVGSAYWAQASKASVAGNSGSSSTDFSIPGEVGANLYYQYYLKENKIGFYSGYDFEKLNTFNTDQVVGGSAIKNIDNKIHYLTAGITKGFTLFDLNMNLKASFSKTIASSTSGTKALTGSKYILFYTYKPEGRFNFNLFFKHHSLTGPTKLSINRIGLSIGVLIF